MRAPSLPPDLLRDVAQRRTFAIISHPDAGKTTLTEKLLLFGGAIQLAGTVKARKSARHATSDWMEVEKQRGISVTSSVMQFDVRRPHDQPARHAGPPGLLRGHLPRADRGRRRGDGDRRREGRRGADDQAARGVPAARHADHHVRQQDGPRGARAARRSLEEIESVLGIDCAPITWPIGMGKAFRGVFDLLQRPAAALHARRASGVSDDTELIEGLDNPRLDALFPDEMAAAAPRRRAAAQREPAVRPRRVPRRRADAGVLRLRHQQLRRAGDPAGADRVGAAAAAARRRRRASSSRPKPPFTGFVFKIQANMDPRHRDRIAFFRVCSGRYAPGNEGAAPARRARDEARQRADVHGERARDERGRGRRRHHRHPQPRAAADRRHADRRRGARVQGHPVLRAGALPRRAPARSVQGEAARRRGCRSSARKARSRCSRPCRATPCCSARSGRCSSRSSRTVSRPSTRSTRSTRARTSRPRAGSRIPTRQSAATSSASSAATLATDVDGNPVFLATNKYNLQVTMERWPQVGFRDDARARGKSPMKNASARSAPDEASASHVFHRA